MTPTPTAGPTATPTATPKPTATATPKPTATPTKKPGPTGSIVIASGDIGIPIGTPEFCVAGCGNEKYFLSAWETLLRVDKSGKVVGNVAESWEIASDLSYYTWHIQPGIQFHKGWGELTADDVVFVFNTINGAVNPASIHDNVGDFAGHIGACEKIDKYTVKMPITKFDVRQPMHMFTSYWQSAGISSKAVYDQYGKEGMRDVFVGTGPYEVKEWVKDDHILLEAVPDHWRKTATVKTVRINKVLEPAARLAMFETGEADMTRVLLKDLDRLVKEKGGVIDFVSSAQFGIYMGGNYLEKVGARSGNPLTQPGFDPSLPWVGDPNAAGCDYDDLLLNPVPTKTVCDSMEKARKVRWAMTQCIDREGISEALYYGMAAPAYVRPVSMDNPVFKDEWALPFDCAAAKQMLVDAGYGSGFDAEMYVGEGTETQELGEAIGGLWLSELGINLTFDRSTYATIRPTYVDRSNKKLVLDSGAGGLTAWPLDWPQGQEDNSWFEGGTMKAGSIPFSAITYGKMMGETDKDKRLELAIAWFDMQHYWKWQPGVIEVPTYNIYNGNKLTWNKQSITSWPWGGSDYYPLEDVALK